MNQADYNSGERGGGWSCLRRCGLQPAAVGSTSVGWGAHQLAGEHIRRLLFVIALQLHARLPVAPKHAERSSEKSALAEKLSH